MYPPWYNKKTKQVDWEMYEEKMAVLSEELPTLSRWQWGVCYAADVQGQYAYIGNGDLFQVLDLTDPSNPVIVGELSLGSVSVISVRDSIAYVLGSRFFTVDISDPPHPKKLGELYFPWPMRVVPTDSFAYVSYFGGLAIVDITDPTNLTIRNSTGLPGEFPVGLIVKERTVYLSMEDDMRMLIFDVSDPDNPSTTVLYTNTFLCGLAIDSFLVTGSYGSVEVYNITDPDNPVPIGSVEFGSGVNYYVLSITRDNSTVYVSTVNEGVFAIDISNIETPVLRDSLEWPYNTTYELWKTGLAVIGSHLIASNTVGLSIIDRTNIDSLWETKFFPTGGVQTSIDVKDSLAFIGAGMAGMWILDISDPFNPIPVSNIFFPDGFTADILVSDTLVYLVNWVESGYYYDGRGLWIVDINDVGNPTIVSHHIGITKHGTYVIHKNTIAKEGNLVFLIQTKAAASDSVLEIIDVSDPLNPTMLSSLILPYSPYRMCVRDSIVYLGTTDGGLRIIDCHNPLVPIEIASILSTARGVTLKDSLAFIVGNGANLYVYNIATPGSPVFVSWTDMPNGRTYLSEVLIEDQGLIYWASDNTKGIIEPSDPLNPYIVVMEDGRATDVAVIGNNLIYTLDEKGVVIKQNTAILNSHAYTFSGGWNLVSLPVRTQSPSLKFNYPSATLAYAYFNAQYQLVDSLEPGSGYWLKMESTDSTVIYGTAVLSDTISLVKGWNMVGTLTEPIPVSSVITEGEGVILTGFYSYDGGYNVSDSLIPGRGYWIKVSDTAKLILSQGSIANSIDVPTTKQFNKANNLLLEDRFGNTQTLYFSGGNEQIHSPSAFEMPPVGPFQQIEARFLPNSVLGVIPETDSVGIPLRLTALRYPIRLSWNVKEADNSYEILKDNIPYEMGITGEIQINSTAEKLSIRRRVAGEPPRSFRVEQNFPNPFNAKTNIKIHVPQAGSIFINLLNVLGETIITKREEVTKSGEYVFQLDLTDQPSGIYFYQVQSGTTSITRKLSFLK